MSKFKLGKLIVDTSNVTQYMLAETAVGIARELAVSGLDGRGDASPIQHAGRGNAGIARKLAVSGMNGWTMPDPASNYGGWC